MNKDTSDERKDLGKWGETMAVKFVKRKMKLRILERNYRSGSGEIDIIAGRGEVLVFVEVRTRREESDPLGVYYSINHHKRKVLRKTAFAYLRKIKNHSYRTIRFDVIAIVGDKLRGHKLTHWENVGIFSV